MPTESRHPLALLDLLIRVSAAAQHPGGEHEDLAERFVQVMADPATGEQLRALRAQAEAEAGPDVEAARAHRWLTLRNDLTSVFEKLGCFDESGEWRDTDEADQWRALAHKIYESADRLGRMNRSAALAQAGGES